LVKTTLNKIRKQHPCEEGWKKLLTYLGKTKADVEELSLITILESNGLNDAFWCLRAVDSADRDLRLFAVWCAREVQHLMADQRSIDSLDVAERYANGQATNDELIAASDAAWDAASDAAWDAVRAAASDAASSAAGDAARAARDAASDAALAAAMAAASDAARAAASDAASDAAWAAALAAARAAARAAASDAAWDAALAAARAAQKDMFIKMCKGEAPWQEVEVE
jgi:hypothetical protein